MQALNYLNGLKEEYAELTNLVTFKNPILKLVHQMNLWFFNRFSL